MTYLQDSLGEEQKSLFIQTINKNSEERVMIQDIFEYAKNTNQNNNFDINNNIFQYTSTDFSTYYEEEQAYIVLNSIKAKHKVLRINEALQNIMALQKRIDSPNIVEIYLFWQLGNLLRDLNKKDDAIQCYKDSIAVIEKFDEENILDLGILHFKIAEMMQDMDCKGACLQEIEKSMVLLKQFLSFDDPRIIKLMLYQGDTNYGKEDNQSALHCYQQCCVVSQKDGLDTIGIFGIQILEKVSTLFYLCSEYQNALKFFTKTLVLKEQFFVKGHISISETYNNLAETQRKLNNFDLAIKYYEKSLRGLFINQEENKEQIYQVYNNLGIVYSQQKQFDRALVLLKSCLKQRKIIYGSYSDQAMETQINISLILDQQKNHTESIGQYDEIINYFKSKGHSGCFNSYYLQALSNKGIALYNINDFRGANSCFNEALRQKKNKYGPSHLTVAVTLQNSGMAYHKIGQYKKALQLYQEALQIYKKKVPLDHPEIKVIKDNIKITQRFDK